MSLQTAGCIWKGDPEQLARSYVYATSQKGVVSMTDSVPLCVSVQVSFLTMCDHCYAEK